MGLLDDLEQEAQRRKASLDDVARQKAENESVYKSRLEPAMQALHDFVARLVQNLTFLKPKRPQRYALAGYGDIVGYIDHVYDLKLDAQQFSRTMTLAVECVIATEECPAVEVQGAAKIKAMALAFQKHRIAGLGDGRKDESGEVVQATFRARGKIPISAVITTDADNPSLRMAFTNFDQFGTVTRVVAPEQLDDALFDNLARFIAREPSGLMREELPDEVRKQLQHKIQQEQMRRKWEDRMAEQQRTEMEQLKRQQSVRGRIERAVQDVSGKGPSLLDKVKGMFKKGDG